MRNKSTLNVFESYEDFVSSLNNTIFEETSSGGATVTPLGDTGISAVTFPKEGLSFGGGDTDTKPYILLINDSVEFQSYANNQTVTVEFSSDNLDKPGVYKRISKMGGEPTQTWVKPNLGMDMTAALIVLSAVVGALYSSGGGVTADRVKQVVKAMKIIKTDFPTEIEKNSLFSALYKQILVINSKTKVNDLQALLGSNRPGNETVIFDGVKAALKA